jgi:hypothetical protein
MPEITKSQTRVKHGEQQGGDDHQSAVEEHEKGLIVCELAVKPVQQFSTSEDASNQNAEH